MWYRTAEDGVSIDLVVQPRASRRGLGPIQGDRLKVRITAAPVDGEANADLVALLAKTFRIPKRDVIILAGERGRRKTVLLRGVGAQQLEEQIAPMGKH